LWVAALVWRPAPELQALRWGAEWSAQLALRSVLVRCWELVLSSERAQSLA
jgi:hypothetical protein